MSEISVTIDRLVIDRTLSRRELAGLGEGIAQELARSLQGAGASPKPRHGNDRLAGQIAAAIRSQLPVSIGAPALPTPAGPARPARARRPGPR
jgi:hypothetical protein